MNELAFRIAMQSIREERPKDNNDIEKILFKAMDLIKSKKITDANKLYTYMENAGVSKKEFADSITDIVKNTDKPERLIQLGLFLGEGSKGSGISLLKSGWWERNLPDDTLRKLLSPQWWKLFRDNMWLERNKVTKN